MLNFFKKILFTSCLVQLAVSMETPDSSSSSTSDSILEAEIVEGQAAEESVVGQKGFYGRLLASTKDSPKSKEELQEEMIEWATVALAYKKDLINLFMSQLKEATFEYEGEERKKSRGILNFLKYKLENSDLKLEIFKDSFNRSEHTKTMKDVGIGKFNCGDEETQRMHALRKSNLYKQMLAFIRATDLVSFKDNPIIATTIAEMTKTNLENFKGWSAKTGNKAAKHYISEFVRSLKKIPTHLDDASIYVKNESISGFGGHSKWICRDYASDAKANFTPEHHIKLMTGDPQAYLMAYPIPSLSQSLDKQELRFDYWLENHQTKWEERYLELVKPDNIIETLTLLLSEQAQVEEDTEQSAKQ
ncbi:hypothetical protein [Candidatus Odyssella thessalonicensis]|uniref:hypothetical protein n=1 Tax=Candidatus Odyssella thessalonicensis TaxID=84647 RepID=UPI000225BC69|nr:hypothetical protein [Candidatus Odyssella thessalonicensis]